MLAVAVLIFLISLSLIAVFEVQWDSEHVGELAPGFPCDPATPGWLLPAVTVTRRTPAQSPKVAGAFRALHWPCLAPLPEEAA